MGEYKVKDRDMHKKENVIFLRDERLYFMLRK